jgi:hypothetical protein
LKQTEAVTGASQASCLRGKFINHTKWHLQLVLCGFGMKEKRRGVKLLRMEKEEEGLAEKLVLAGLALFHVPHNTRAGLQMAMMSRPQTDGIKPFVLCRESRDMVCWVDPTFTL